MTNFEILAWIVAAGAFGGFVDGLIVQRSYTLRWKGARVDLGSMGDALVGAAAGIAIFTVAGALLNVTFENLDTPKEFMKLTAWGVLSGFAGLRLLQGMSEKLVRDVATKAAEDAVKKSVAQDVEVTMNIKSAEAALTKYDMAKEYGLTETKKGSTSLLEVARNKFELALARQPENEEALRGVAKINKRLALEAEVRNDMTKRGEYLKEAIDILSKVIDRNPYATIAYYNRACYRQLSKAPLAEVIDDLRRAIELNVALKGDADQDPDFAAIKQSPEFRNLVQ